MRIDWIDNLKGLLIVLVVIGHMLLPVNNNDLVTLLFRTIYLFHMPLFVFVSGLLSKRVFNNGVLRVEKIISFVLLAFIFQGVLVILESKPDELFSELRALSFGGAPWYLLSLATWYALTPIFNRIRPLYCVTLSVLIALCAGYVPGLGNFLSLSRTVVFMPFFLIGYYCDAQSIQGSIRKRGICWIALVASIVFVIALWATNGSFFADQYPLVYGNSPYKVHGLLGPLYRLEVFAVAVMLSIAMMFLTPKSHVRVLSYLGKRTLQIYILHRIARTLLTMAGLYHISLLQDPVVGLLILLGVSFAVTALCALPFLDILFNWLLNCKWTHFLKPADPKKD